MPLLDTARRALTDPRSTRWTCPLQLAADAILCILITSTIPYTEIDWRTYMQQIALYTHGERDYAHIAGDTGPLVYPAAHVHVYRALYALTSAGQNIAVAQGVFVVLYVAALAVVMACYRAAGVPPWVFPLLSGSKRCHSVFVLRLFNDGVAVGLLWGAVWCWQRRWWTVGSLVYSFGVGVKMSLLLALPAVGVVLWLGVGRDRALWQAQAMGQLQTLLAYPFIMGGWKSYVTRAFEFSRVFMYKWTVNWRFVGESTFLSKPFSYALMGTHLTLLYTFGVGRWLQPAGWSGHDAVSNFLAPPSKERQARIARQVTPEFILTSILSAVIIGCLCARSLHYQFYVYIVWSTPFLLWRSGMHPVLIYAICMAQEWGWNVYPSTDASSMVVVGCLAATVGSVWIGTSPHVAAQADAAPAERAHGHAHAHAE